MTVELEVIVPRQSLLTFGKKHLRSALRKAGAEVAAEARRLIRRSAGGGRIYRSIGMAHQASLPGQPPASWTGLLAGSIRVSPARSGDAVRVIDAALYAKFLEVGATGGGRVSTKRSHRERPFDQRRAAAQARGATRVMLPRPFLSAALENKRASIEARLREAIIEDVEFQREA